MSHFLLCTHNALQSSYFRRLSDRSRKLAHQREVMECLVGTFCKYNVLPVLGNLPLNYRMFPPDIDKQPKLNLIGGLEEVRGELECGACVKIPVKVRWFQQPQLKFLEISVRHHVMEIMVNEHIWGPPADQSTQLTERSIPVVCSVCKTTSADQLLPMLVSEWLMLRQKFLYKMPKCCYWLMFMNTVSQLLSMPPMLPLLVLHETLSKEGLIRDEFSYVRRIVSAT